MANGLKKTRVVKGDRVCIYMPMVPEQVVAMLACARIGAIHSVVFGGFGAAALNNRIKGAEAKIVITADVATAAAKQSREDTLKKRSSMRQAWKMSWPPAGSRQPVELHKEMEVDYHELMEGDSSECEPEVMDAEDPLFILYTSGSTGTPKGIVHTCGGYMVGTYYTTLNVFDLKDKDVYWCTADTGWITGHNYVVYGPFCVGATVVLAEGVPITRSRVPLEGDPGFGVTIFYTAPTAIRMFMRVGDEWPDKYNLSSLRISGRSGSPSTPKPLSGITGQSGRTGARSSTPGGRPRPGCR